MKTLIYLLTFLPFTLIAQNPLERLENSPRHHEWVDVKYGDREVKAFLVFPEVSESVPVVIVIHENRGLNDWARSMADQIAEAGYIALAPDLLSGSGPDGKGTSSFANSDDARTAIYALDADQVTNDLNATVAYAKEISASNGKVAVIGFCWGGSQSFRFATNNDEIKAAFVCYGTGPAQEEAYKNIVAPVYGFYGGNDNRVNATIENSKKMMEANNKIYEPVIYEGAGHGFFRAGEAEDASEANKKGREEGLKRLKKLLAEI
jgi:carboxymethylenebutenolidase